MAKQTLKKRLQSVMDTETLAMENEDIPLNKWDDRILRALILEFRLFLIENSSHKTNYAFLVGEAYK